MKTVCVRSKESTQATSIVNACWQSTTSTMSWSVPRSGAVYRLTRRSSHVTRLLRRRVSTSSTKSRDRKVAKKAPTTPIADQPDSNGPVDLSPRVWWIASLAILVVAAAVRLYALELKPMHHDEGVNGHFLKGL